MTQAKRHKHKVVKGLWVFRKETAALLLFFFFFSTFLYQDKISGAFFVLKYIL